MTIFWIIVTLVAVIVEIATQALVSTWFAVAGLVALALAYFGFPAPIQVAAFFAVSVFSFALIRRYVIPYTRVKFIPTNSDRLLGQEAQVTKEIMPRARGEVTVLGQVWSARSDDPAITFNVDEVVTIRAIEGATLIVSALDDET